MGQPRFHGAPVAHDRRLGDIEQWMRPDREGIFAKLNSRHALMVESRFFGGLDVNETAQLLDVSEATVMRDWRAVKAWLSHRIRQ